MNRRESMRAAWESLASNKPRAALTMLGIIIGVAAVITMLAIARGAKAQTMERIQRMGTNVMFVFAGRSTGTVRGSLGSSQTLTLDDAEAIADKCPSVQAVAPEVQANEQLKYGNQNTNTQVIGTSPEYETIRDMEIAQGRWFTDVETESSRKVAVIGPDTAETLFGGESPIGEYMRVGALEFKIVGMTKAKGAMGPMNPDDQVFIPVTTAMKRLIGTQYVRSIDVQGLSMDQMSQAEEEVDALLRKRHKITDPTAEAFMIRSQADIVEMAEETNRVFTLLLASIASVSLIVGGIGIMNIMLVSVTERTREIGIRIAIGARRRDIRAQFLVEALLLSLAGGSVGVVLGVIASFFMGKFSQWEATVSPLSILVAFGFAAFVGVFFGYYPARQASRLNPIDALRYE